MKIKRYAAPTMRAALAQVRSEQGPDAVILSSRRGEEGIEVIAAVDYDEALFVDATRQRVTDRVSAALAAPPPPLPATPIPGAAAPQAAAAAVAPRLGWAKPKSACPRTTSAGVLWAVGALRQMSTRWFQASATAKP